MEQIRKPFQGVLNIIRFNWHFYVIAFSLVLVMFYTANYFGKKYVDVICILLVLTLSSIIVSLLASLLRTKFKNAELIVLDFYNPEKHTEVSIKRARKAYPPFPNTKQIKTSNTELADNSIDKIFVILSAHEIRNEIERIDFFKELNRVIKLNGQIYVTEHLRDFPNFLAYNIGFFHFHTKSSWLKTFNDANLKIRQEIKLTPFISTFILDKNGNTF
jgi:energy-coupling factor transporter transmembrane protein EcfT